MRTKNKTVAIYDIFTGELLYIAKSMAEAGRYIGCSRMLIYKAVNNLDRVKHLKDKYKVILTDDKVPPSKILTEGSIKHNRKKLQVVKLDLNKNFISLYNSLTEASKSIKGANAGNILISTRKPFKASRYGYYWVEAEYYLKYCIKNFLPIPPQLDKSFNKEERLRLKEKGIL